MAYLADDQWIAFMATSAATVANYFIDKAAESGTGLTMLQLIKLVYIAHGWSLAALDRGVIGDEQIQAWRHGPVIPSLYHEFKRFGRSIITRKATDFIFSNENDQQDLFTVNSTEPSVDPSDSDLVFILDYVWAVYKQYSAGDLVSMTHQPGSPWSQCYSNDQQNRIIDDETIKHYYKDKILQLVSQVDANAG